MFFFSRFERFQPINRNQMNSSTSLTRSSLQLSLAVLAIIVLSACGSKRNLVYFSNLPDSTAYQSAIVNDIEATIQPGDILRITVTSLHAETNRLFNTGTMPVAGETAAPVDANLANEGYLVNRAGYITFPIVGQLLVEGLTREQARQKLVNEVSRYAKDPIINIRFTNFKITVVGEVNSPSTFTVPSEKINIIEALGLAGDMTPYGKRENVLLIREQNGERTVVRLNLNDKETLNSSYFYLRQNDVVYVEPVKHRDPTPDRNLRILTVSLAALSTVVVILTRLL